MAASGYELFQRPSYVATVVVVTTIFVISSDSSRIVFECDMKVVTTVCIVLSTQIVVTTCHVLYL